LAKSSIANQASSAFFGSKAKLFAVMLSGYLLMLLSAGIYRFWLTTNKRQYYWSHTKIDGEALEYTGTPIQLLVGFVLGDITGLSVAGGVGSVLINNSFSREAERAADEFSSSAASRMNFAPSTLADLLDRVGEDEQSSKALALFGTHPLNQQRREALQNAIIVSTDLPAPFSDKQWQAIKSMCGGIGQDNSGAKTTKIKT